MPEWCGKVLNNGPNSYQETALSSVHAQSLEGQTWDFVRLENVWETHLEVNGQQREEGTKGTKEQEVEGLGNVHLILDHLDRPPETLERISSSLFWRFSQICYSGLEGLLSPIDAVVIVEAGLLPLGQTDRGFVLVSDCLGKYSS